MEVSLVIPAYNVENLIGYTLESVKSQTSKSFECIIVNDCSTDNTQQVIKNSILNDKRFKLVNHRANAGLSAARNTGIRLAKGKYIAFLDSDDLLMSESLEFRANTLNNCEDPYVVGTYCGSESIAFSADRPPKKTSLTLRKVDFISTAGNCPFNANQPMFKREVFKKFGGFDPKLTQAEDYDMWLRVLRAGLSIIPTNFRLVTYRQTPGSMIKRDPLKHLDNSTNMFFSSYTNLSFSKINPKFPNYLKEGLGNYIAELNIANRVLEFVGLALAKGDSEKAVVDRLEDFLPSYFDIIEQHRPFKKGVMKGVTRFFNNEKDKIDESITARILDVYNSFHKRMLRNKVNNKNNTVDIINLQSIVSDIGLQPFIPIIFIPHKDYHVHCINLIKPHLEHFKIPFMVVDISSHYRDEGVVAACKKYDIPSISYGNFLLGSFKPKIIAAFNDWDPIVKTIMNAANISGIATIGIVEGIQDYLDADTKQLRNAYKTVKTVMLPGEHDKKYFDGSEQELVTAGVPRIFDMRKRKNSYVVKSKNKKVLINTNFSYGVLEDKRDSWLTDAFECAVKTGYEVVITRHPADKGTLYSEHVTSKDFYSALAECDIFISRFASGILEALAVDKEVIYFNPHGEKVDKFKEPCGAYFTTESKGELQKLLTSKKIKSNSKSKSKWLDFHTGDYKNDPSEIIANKLRVKCSNLDNISYERFFSLLEFADKKSGCFNNLSILRKNNIFDSCDLALDPKVSIKMKDINNAMLNEDYTLAFYLSKKLVDQFSGAKPFVLVRDFLDSLIKLKTQ